MRTSASQIATFTDCQRKWAWRYIAGISSPPNASAELGIAVHAQLEAYLSGGTFDFTVRDGEVAEIASSGIEHLPLPGTPGMVLEEEFHFEGPSGHTYLGYKDVEITPPAATAATGGVYQVIDHKTTSDLKWAKTPGDLRKDPQATLYAVDAFRRGAEAVDLKWIYYQTKRTRKSQVTHLRVYPEETFVAFQAIEKVVETMSGIKDTITDPLLLPPSVEHCSAYGGCSYQGNCNLSPFEKLRSTMTQGTTNSLLEKMRARKAAAGGGVATNPPEWQPPPVDAAARDAAVTSTTTPSDFVRTGILSSGPISAPILPAEAAAPVATPAAPPPPAETPKRGPGRPRKVDAVPAAMPAVLANAPTYAQTAAAATHAADAAMASAYVGAFATATTPTLPITTLFIDCGPVGVACVDGYTFILAAKVRLRAEGIEDYRLVDFGQGPGRLALAVGHEIDAQKGRIGWVRVDSHSPEGNATLGTFIERAAVVVRA